MNSETLPNVAESLVKRAERFDVILLETDDGYPRLVAWPSKCASEKLVETLEQEVLPELDGLFSEYGYQRFVAENRACCPTCGEIVESSVLLERAQCSCGNLVVSGGCKQVVRECELPRYTDLVTFGWAREDELEDAAVRLLESRLPIRIMRERMLRLNAPRLYELTGSHNGADLSIRMKGRTKFEAAHEAMRAYPGFSVRVIADLEMSDRRRNLFTALDLNGEASEQCLSYTLDEWEGTTSELVDTARSKRELAIIVDFAIAYLHDSKSARNDALAT